jgi:hypothetical protein
VHVVVKEGRELLGGSASKIAYVHVKKEVVRGSHIQ